MDSVRIIRSEKDAKLLLDPMRREILRLLAWKTLTETNLSNALGLSAPTVGHHLTSLRRAGLLEFAGSETGDHGILEKFYRATAQAYVLDMRQMSPKVRRYFMPNKIERTRGMLAALSLNRGGSYKPSSELVEKITEDLALYLLEAAERRQGPSNGGDPEWVVNEIYREALENLLKSRAETLPQILRAG